MKIRKLCYLLILSFPFIFYQCKEKTSGLGNIFIEGGEISGIATPSPGIMLYAGLPYAAPPVGDLRWKEPQPVVPWEGVRKADAFPKVCYQYPMDKGSFYEKEFYMDGMPELSEDCLYLNVWTPAQSNKEKLPVLMWVHGGGFDHGWGHEIEFDGEALAKKGIILVTINYRVGVFGFLAHPWLDAESPFHSSGNYGILDQIAALQWIQKNIAQFGGDPAKVTIAGQSAGARSMMVLLSSPLTKNLFGGAIIQSGGGYRRGSITTQEAREEICKEFADYVHAQDLNALRALKPMDLMEQHRAFNKERQEKGESTFRFSPNVDGYVLTEDFDTTLDEGNQYLVPAIVGYNSQDGSPEVLEKAASQWALIRESQNQSQTYIYQFERQLPGDDAGAFHSAELWYVFGTLGRSWRPFNDADYKLSEQMLSYWSNFIKTGNPNGNNVELWEPYGESHHCIKQFEVE